MLTARYGLIPYIKQITSRHYKVMPVHDDGDDDDGSDGDFTSN